MTREIRSRRAGLSRVESRQQPLYSRLLGLQYVTPNGFLCFVFFEGAVALGILLALAELVSWWGVLVLPITVGLMVKLNDVVAGAVIQTPSVDSRASRASASAAHGTRASVSRTSAPAEDLPFFVDPAQSGTRITPAAVPAVRRAAVRPAAATTGGYAAYPTGGYAAYPAGGHGTGGSASGGYVPGGVAFDRHPGGPGMPDVGADTSVPLRAADMTPAVVRAGRMPAAPAQTPSASRGHQPPDVPDVSGPNGPPVAGHWDAPTEQLDSPLRWARQAASRRYQ